ncbi:MAG: hypothetical protein ACXWWD_08695 [Chitinophagaceae bacterium]
MKFIFLYSLVTLLSLIDQQPVFGQTGSGGNEKFYIVATGATVLNFNGTINSERILLNWTIDKNQGVDQIEVERRSNDEKNFVMAGLVFGTDEPDKVDYLFYEKNKGTKSFYRLRIINKDRTVSYSSIISPEPATAKR